MLEAVEAQGPMTCVESEQQVPEATGEKCVLKQHRWQSEWSMIQKMAETGRSAKVCLILMYFFV